MKIRRSMLVYYIVAYVLTVALPIAFAADPGSSPAEKIAKEDGDFVTEAASGGLMEVQLGKLAAERASNSAVKEFGQRMQKDHSKANDELKKNAAKKGIKLPTTLEGKHKSTVDKLSKLKGDEFDREYMSVMVDDHKEDIEKFERAANKAKDPDVKKFAQEQLPILKKHLALAEQTRKKMSGSTK